MSRLAALEGHLLANAATLLPDDGTGRPGHVSIIKNYGRQVGASLSHGHQQIVLSNVMPRRIEENRRFQVARGETFAAHLLRHNPAGLGVADYGPAVLLVPYCMRRPYDMTLIVKETDRAHLHELSADEIKAVARGWHDATRAIHAVMPELGREPAFNVVVHNGPGAGLYFEFLPYTQEEGGLEKLGLVICQQTPGAVALHVRQLLAWGG
jgi:galactose-1-phosphate uridylyltransferase